MTMPLLFISGAEIAFIIFIIVMVFGADKIPGIARGLGKGMAQLRNATDEIKAEIQRSADITEDDLDLTKDIREEIKKTTDDIDDVIGPVSRGMR